MKALSILLLVLMVGCSAPNPPTYTLYRSSVTNPRMRVHVATFDTASGEDYNRENCDIARGLFERQPGVIVKYWCEKGVYRE